MNTIETSYCNGLFELIDSLSIGSQVKNLWNSVYVPHQKKKR